MTEPSITMTARTTGSGTFSVALIIAGTVQTGDIRWSGTADEDGFITIPASGNMFADYLYFGSTQIADGTQQPDQTPSTAMIKVETDNYDFDIAPKFTVYDSTSYTEVEEMCTGTANLQYPLIKGRISTSSAVPAQYWGESTEDDLHEFQTLGAVTSGNQGLCGATSYLQATTTNLNTTPEYLWIALSIPDDVTSGLDSVDGVITIEYTFTA